MMAEESTFERVKRVVIEALNVDAEAEGVVDDAACLEELDADSLDAVTIVMMLEEEFGIEIPDEDADTIETAGDAVKVIDRLCAA